MLEDVLAAKRRSKTTLITSAAKGRTLDLEERNKRYLISMSIRMVLLGLIFVVPGWWKLVFLVAGAIIPVFAVVLANNYEEAETVEAADETPSDTPALPAAEVIPGTTEDQA